MPKRWLPFRLLATAFVLTFLLANLLYLSVMPASSDPPQPIVKVASTAITWTTKASMPTARFALGLASGTDGKIYAVGGAVPGGTTNAVEAYDPLANSWTARASMPTSRYELSLAAAPNGKIYAVGGTSGTYLTTVEEYDPVANSWASRAPMAVGRTAFALVAGANGKIYALGGYNSGAGGDLSSVEEYDPASNSWTSKAPMPQAKAHLAGAGTADGSIWAIGGGGSLATVHKYNPGSNTWTAGPSMPVALNQPLTAAAGNNGKIYVAGYTAGATRVYEFDTGANTWTASNNLPDVRQRTSSAFAGGKLYVVGGCGCDSPVYSTVFEGSFGPESRVSALPTYQSSSFTVSWIGTAAANPIASYDVQYKDGASGTWTDWLSATTATSATFGPASPVTVTEGHTYYFQSRVRDTGDAVEAYPGGNGDASTLVDTIAPSGTFQVQGWSSPHISNTVSLSVSASDATSGVSQMQLGTDGQTFSAWTAYTTTVTYSAPAGATAAYARFKDNAGNISQPVSATITLDATPPGGTLQVQGWSSPYISNTVTLSVSATDATSGVSQMQFGPDGQSWNSWEPYATSSLYVAPPGATAVYARFKDNAGNISQPVSATITLDSTPPTGSVSINAGASYAAAISVTLTLAAADSNGVMSEMSLSNDSSSWSDWQGYATSKSWSMASGADGPRAVYARFRDVAQNVSSVYSDTIILDTTAPTGTVSINGGASDVGSTSVTLSLSASDALSGVSQMSVSNDGLAYSDWETFATSKFWSLLGGNGGKTAYARFRDNVGNVSTPVSDTIVLNSTLPTSAVNPLSPFQSTAAFTVTWSGTALGSGLHHYDIQYKDGSAGTWTDWLTNVISTTTSAVFSGSDGHTYYFQSRATDQAGNVEPYVGGDGHTHTTVDLVAPTGSLSINGGALDSTSVNVTLVVSATESASVVTQSSYSNDGASWSPWEAYTAIKMWTLTSGDGEKTVWARFADTAGNVSAPVSDTIRLDTSVRSVYGLSVNDGALFTRQVSVTLSIPAYANTAELMLSNDGGFADADWQPYSAYKLWAVTRYGSFVIPRTVYARYRDVSGNISGTFQDDIILDVRPPRGSVSIQGAGPSQLGSTDNTVTRIASAVTLSLSASDDESGVGGMMVSSSPSFSGTSWESFASSKPWDIGSSGRVYVTYKDNADNASPVYAATVSGSGESLPPPAMGTVHPKTGGQIASEETKIAITFPPGAVGAKADVTLVPAVESNLQSNTGSLKSAGKFLTLTAKAGDSPITSFSMAYTMSINYTDADIAGINEDTLRIYTWNGMAWVKEAGSTVNKSTRTVSAAIDHLSSFALLGESATTSGSTTRIYLPLVTREASGW